MAISKNGTPIVNVSGDTLRGLMIPAIPTIPRIFEIFDPRIFPTIMPYMPFLTIMQESSISGRLVPSAKKNIEATDLLMPSVVDTSVKELIT
ncbi:MAG: hypothetical protein N4A36_02280 [Candidatus Gracilibacteria bacterium]|nr:hypothetical protein [Candidatus Gracilibacteria bacterium]